MTQIEINLDELLQLMKKHPYYTMKKNIDSDDLFLSGNDVFLNIYPEDIRYIKHQPGVCYVIDTENYVLTIYEDYKHLHLTTFKNNLKP